MNETLSRSYVYFAFHGDDFEPKEVTRELEIEPTDSWKKGDRGRYLPDQKYACWKWSTGKSQNAIQQRRRNNTRTARYYASGFAIPIR
ncbi:DUF4279 domain-containing protein [Pontibacter virosus]|uniref:DUF4279 domain-containing protein n=1 Tax=Pontibacter virosus TaxID=1765052 RepID=UPI000E307D74|nr:DUF4279 domain-containing protein [Pontibacter virosus]